MRNLFKSTLVLMILFSALHAFSQSASQAERLFNSAKYSSALKIYTQLVEKNPNNNLNQYRLARCYYELKNYPKAIDHFLLSGTKYPLIPYYLGLSYFENYQFEEASNRLKNYLSTLDSLKPDYHKVVEKIKKAEIATPLMNRVEKLFILDSVICSKNDFLKYYHYSAMAGKLKQKLIKSKNTYKDQISYHTQRNDRHIFSEEINGKMDILTSFQLLNDWSDPVSISNNINTGANENYPFLMPDGATFYFATDGQESIGGYDIMITKYTAALKDFLKPENVGFPFNSFANDYMMVVDESKGVGWFASDRGQKPGKLIIYQFEITSKREFFTDADSVDLVDFAKLKKYFRSEKLSQVGTNEHPVMDTLIVDEDWNLMINDTLVYHNESQFKSSKALKLFDEWYKLNQNLQNKNEQLVLLRQKYMVAENEGAKRELKPQILDLEVQVVVLKRELSNKELEIRNEEIKSLNL